VTVPLGIAVPEPVTVTATETGVLSAIEFLPGDTVTIGVALGELPPFPLPVLPLLLGDDEPQPIAARPIVVISIQAVSMCFHLRVRPGMKKTIRASTAVPPAVLNHFEPPKGAVWSSPEVGAVVFTETLAVPVVTVELSETAEPATEQVGSAVAPAGEEASTQLSVTAPVYPPLPVTVTVDVPAVPGAIADGLVADSVKAGGVTAVTVTVAVPVADA
jgi:hypothetical protein